MKKILRTLMTVLLLSAVAIPMSFVNVATSSAIEARGFAVAQDFFEDEKYLEEYANYLEEKYGENYEDLLARNAHSSENADIIRSLFPRNKEGELIYPDFFGGIYIDSDHDLVIQIVKNNVPKETADNYSLFANTLSVDKSANIEYVDYSFAEAAKVMTTITDYYRLNFPIKVPALQNGVRVYLDSYTTDNVIAYYDDVIGNRVVVELRDYSEKKVAEFRNTVIDSPLIVFKPGTEYVEYNNPGARLASIGCTLGYRARVSTTNVGVVTAGHCVPSGVGTVILALNGTLFGTVWSWRNSGNVDAAYITTHNVTITNTLNRGPSGGTGPTLSTAVKTSFTVGDFIGKVGWSSNWTTGTVTNVNFSHGGLTGLINTSAWGQPGDSGAIVFGGSATAPTTAGILRGGPNSTGGNFCFTRADRINSAFGTSRY